MSAFTPASEVLLRLSDDFEEDVFCLPEICRMTCPRVSTVLKKKVRAHTQCPHHHWQVPSRQMGERALSLAAEQSDIADCDTLIYYWPKTSRKPSSS